MKKIFLPFIICAGTISILIRLFYLQVLDKDTRKDNIASDVAIEVSYDYPERGYIYDRNDFVRAWTRQRNIPIASLQFLSANFPRKSMLPYKRN